MPDLYESRQAGALTKLISFLEDYFDAPPATAESAAQSILLLLGLPSPESFEELGCDVS